MYSFPDTTDILGFYLTNRGFKIRLKAELPDTIINHFHHIINPLLDRNNLSIDKINYFIFHPGGKKIIDKIDNILAGYNKNLSETKEVMRLYGNMSSPTILFVLEKCINKYHQEGDYGFILGFGPGFTAHSLLIKWC
jgi:predicted naringenin-chalcone synthase